MMSFQDILPSATPRYRYKGYDKCIKLLEEQHDKFEREGCAYNPYFIMDIDERSFLECFVNSGDMLLARSWEIYDHTYQSALLNMVESSPHAVASSELSFLFALWARQVTRSRLIDTSTRTVRGISRTKQADFSFTPSEMPNGQSQKWPTLVGEIAWSEPRSKLIQDMQFWLEHPRSTVNTAITLSILRGRILIESWAVSNDKPLSPTQTIEIFRNPPLGCPQIKGRLEVKFSDVFLREPRAGSEERNFVMTRAEIQELADRIWEAQYRIGS